MMAGRLAWSLVAGATYFAGVFALGFALGVPRTLWLAPALGPTAAVLIELPVILGFSWWWCRRLLARRRLDTAGRALMGASAFALLILAELALSMLLAGRTVGEHFALYVQPQHLLGLAGQVAFAALPLALGDRAPRA